MTHEVLVVHEEAIVNVSAAPPEPVEVVAGFQGPPGPPGSPGSGYVHTQASAETEWLINHNLGVRPAVAVIDTGGNELDVAVQHMSLNQLRIYFVTPTAGFARLT